QERSENAFVGVGITISQAEQGFQIMEVEENGPAKEAGVQAGDLLVQVDGQDVARMDANQVKELVRGEEGSTVTLGLLRQEEALSLPVE
ncbi:PDZ domain-containing protein, partial [Acinetobacter baumannii]|nr:PDZ domain-containing protein [Acinetobacter baumannii]